MIPARYTSLSYAALVHLRFAEPSGFLEWFFMTCVWFVGPLSDLWRQRLYKDMCQARR
jgi:hypothetical protein